MGIKIFENLHLPLSIGATWYHSHSWLGKFQPKKRRQTCNQDEYFITGSKECTKCILVRSFVLEVCACDYISRRHLGTLLSRLFFLILATTSSIYLDIKPFNSTVVKYSAISRFLFLKTLFEFCASVLCLFIIVCVISYKMDVEERLDVLTNLLQQLALPITGIQNRERQH